MQDLVGWTVLDVDSFAAVMSPPDDFAVVSGDFKDDTLPSNLTEVDDRIVTDREAEEGEVDLSAPSPLSRVGIPTRLAQQDARIAYSASTGKVRDWLGGKKSLADDTALRALAQTLDDSKVYSAVIAHAVPGDRLPEDGDDQQQRSGPRGESNDLVPKARFEAVGVGGRPQTAAWLPSRRPTTSTLTMRPRNPQRHSVSCSRPASATSRDNPSATTSRSRACGSMVPSSWSPRGQRTERLPTCSTRPSREPIRPSSRAEPVACLHAQALTPSMTPPSPREPPIETNQRCMPSTPELLRRVRQRLRRDRP